MSAKPAGGGDAGVERQHLTCIVFGHGGQQACLHRCNAQAVQMGCGQFVLKDLQQLLVADFGDDELVVGEDAALDGVGQVQLVDRGPVDGGVVHRGEAFEARAGLRSFRACGAPVARGRGHVEAVGDRDGAVVVDETPFLVPVSAGAVGLVRECEVPAWQPVGAVGLGQGRQGRVGGEDRGAPSLGDARDERVRVAGDPQAAAQVAVVDALQRAHADELVEFPVDEPPGRGLDQQLQGGHQDEDRPAGGEVLGDALADQGLSDAAGGDDGRGRQAPGQQGVHAGRNGFFLVRAQLGTAGHEMRWLPLGRAAAGRPGRQVCFRQSARAAAPCEGHRPAMFFF